MASSECNGDTKNDNDARPGPAIALIAAIAMIISGVSLSFAQGDIVIAQATAPQTSPVPAGKENGPAESKPGGTRPTTPAPEPARPDADVGGHADPQPALPPAPAEKVAPPINKN
ncbi:hypothetical protein [Nitrobacter winogradskyi]|nr:hypothetical protein [Nitrobacter winogradskyi]MCP1999091.1 hypothetical protein [Nitrobacter winogradskyi]